MPRKLGQHFLINESAIKKIIASLDLSPDDTVIEVGPGHGELTNELRIKNQESRIVAVEKDKYLASQLQKKFVGDKNIEIIHGDALKELPNLINQLTNQPINYKVIGNIPYYITGRLLRVLSELQNPPTVTVLTIQREVAERIIATPPKMNLLAASVQIWSNPEIVERLEPEDFSPPPEVDSAVIKLTRREGLENKNLEKYFAFIRKLFKQPRKTILNNLDFENLKKTEVEKGLQEINIDPTLRPQNLETKDIERAQEYFSEQF
jgi:16S rRNA (adenine1518-N6/adenine1519-N6)-dimethyltransferase